MPLSAKERKGHSLLACNMCGRILQVENNLLKEDAFFAKKEWGYFSKRDTQVDEFTLCEDCYHEMITKFRIPVKAYEKKEVL